MLACRVLARARSLRAGACVVLAAAAAGCGTAGSNTSVTATGRTLTIYASQPPGGGGQPAEDVINAERLALSQAGGKAGGFNVRLVVLNGRKLSDDARRAIQDKSTIAYLGDIDPGTSGDSIGIVNSQDILQVSPTDTARELTQSTPAVPNSPTLYYESLKTYGRTFARVVPTDTLEAKALVTEMSGQGVKSLHVSGDGSDYAKALADAVTRDARGAGIAQQPAGTADAVLYAGRSGSGAAQALTGAGSASKLFASSAVAFDPAFASALSPAVARRVEVSSPGFMAGDLPATATQQFVAPFKQAYGHAPSTEAIFGYEAMSAVLAVLQQAGSAANNRNTVVKGFFKIKNRQSVLGTYSIDVQGDTSIGPFVFSHVKSGQLAPFKAVQAG